jgi:hypothetical protein
VKAPSDDDLVAYGLGADLGEPGIGLGSKLRPDGSQGSERHRVAAGLGQKVAPKAEGMCPARAERPGRAHKRAGMNGELGSLDYSLYADPSIEAAANPCVLGCVLC